MCNTRSINLQFHLKLFLTKQQRASCLTKGIVYLCTQMDESEVSGERDRSSGIYCTDEL